MAYSGFLVKIGDYTVPAEFISADTYKAKINTQDMDSYTTSQGETIRNTLDYVKPTIEWGVPYGKSENELRAVMNKIRAEYSTKKNRTANVTAFYPETGKYHTLKMYMADPEYVIDSAEFETRGKIVYDKFNLKFVALGGTIEW